MIKIVKRDDVTLEVDTTGLSGTLFITVKREQDLATDDDTLAIIATSTVIAGDTTNLVLSSTDTDVAPGKYVYDLQIVDGGNVSSTEYDDFIVLQDVTVRTS
jgi:NAD/NADP transhydrogenase alpha subunit